MKQGHIVQDGPPDDIYRRPSSVFGADFIGESNLLPATVIAQNQAGLIADIGNLQVQTTSQPAARVGQSVWVSIRPERWARPSRSRSA